MRQDLYITRVKVINFRSLAHAEINLASYTALVGLNDSGKSNLLRALNLFFNNQTDIDQPLNFDLDYSQQAKIVRKKAKQIEIEVEFTVPKTYKEKSRIVWKKTFRSDSLEPYTDKVMKKNGGELGRNSRIDYWLRHIVFEYVPAVRGKNYFSKLKRRLYNTLAATVAPKLNNASNSFLSDLRREVSKIESESERLLQLKTEFTLPANLGELFEILDFDAADPHSKTSLHYRGDGIQGRHIPIILKFLADQRRSSSSKGKPVSETIWGYEEPENNLELIKQIETAKEFENNSKSIQILLSTHSPAFYGPAKERKSIRFAIRNDGHTTFEEGSPSELIDKNLGLMPFIEPYLEKAITERKELIDQLQSLQSETLVKNKAALYVEGDTDKIILEAVFEKLGLQRKFEINSKPKLGAGVNWVVNYCVARAAMVDLNEKTAALFDDDEAGEKAFDLLCTQTTAIGREGRVKTFKIAKRNSHDEIRAIKKSQIKIPFSIEEICGKEIWDFAETKNWLVARDSLAKDNYHLLGLDTKLNDIINSTFHDDHLRRLIKFKINPTEKGKFAKQFAKTLTTEKIPKTLAELAHEIQNYFG